jgi:hypothetical protein
MDFYSSSSTRGSKGVPAYGAVHLMSSASVIPHQGSNKADALSAELQGHMPGSRDVSMWTAVKVKLGSLKVKWAKK